MINPHQEINFLLRSKKEMTFVFPWVSGEFYNKFWAALVGKDGNRQAWLSDLVRHYYLLRSIFKKFCFIYVICYCSNYFLYTLILQHIEAWFMYMWQFRPHDADWVMVGPYFSP